MTLRYVAIGDSQSEGLGDTPLPDGTPRGWTDRLAARLADHHGDIEYANLAVRGSRAGQVRDTQLAPALDLEPDLVTITAGMNDILRPSLDREELRSCLIDIVSTVTARGAQVLLVPLPDVRGVMPVARLVTDRILALNTMIDAMVAEHGARPVGEAGSAVFRDRRMWSPDLLHLGPIGHERLAMAAADTLGLPDVAHWREPLTGPAPGFNLRDDTVWWIGYAGPWMLRRLRGRSSGDGRSAKLPTPITITHPNIPAPSTFDDHDHRGDMRR